jgi:hypothetical protein
VVSRCTLCYALERGALSWIELDWIGLERSGAERSGLAQMVDGPRALLVSTTDSKKNCTVAPAWGVGRGGREWHLLDDLAVGVGLGEVVAGHHHLVARPLGAATAGDARRARGANRDPVAAQQELQRRPPAVVALPRTPRR